MFSPDKWFTQTGFYNGVATQSLRFDIAAASYLTRTPSSASNRRTFTISFWLKPSKDTLNTSFLAARTGSSGTYTNFVFSASDNRIRVVDNNESSYPTLETGRKLRDLNAWYHIVFAVDTTQSTEADRIKIYVNGEEQSYAASNYPTLNRELNVNNTEAHLIGYNAGVANLDGYLSEYNFIDGSQLTPTSFGETKNGVWIAKAYSGSYGTNGFRLQFKETGVGTGSSSTVGADTSGNGNHFTSSGIVASYCNMPDSPENNFATMGQLSFGRTTDNIGVGNLRVGQTDQHVHASTFAIPTSGKWYWEINSVTSNGSNYYFPYAGVVNSTYFHTYQAQTGNAGDDLRNTAGSSYMRGNDAKYKDLTSTTLTDGTNTSTEGQAGTEQGILGLALDNDAGTLKFYWNNSLIRTDSTLTAGDLYFPYQFGTNSGGNLWNWNYYNFGQDSSFVGTKTAQGNKDANGNGDFYYSPPADHLALCTDNLPEPTIGPNSQTQASDHFNSVTYQGNGSSKAVTGYGFQPDWLWIKPYDDDDNHVSVDSSRGITKIIYPNLNNEESTESNMTSFDSDGFTAGNWTNVNENTKNYIAWGWKANGGTTTSHSASDNSATEPSVSQANQTAGFSIVTYTGDTSGHGSTYPSTFNHGIGSTPRAIIVKARTGNGNQNWHVYHEDMNPGSSYNWQLTLNGENAKGGANNAYWGGNTYTLNNNLFPAGSDNSNGANGVTYVAYLFSEVEGFSKFGFFEGNSSTDGTFIYTGFKPKLIISKSVDGIAQWHMADNTLEENPTGYLRIASAQASAEGKGQYQQYDHYDLLSNGFKIRDNGSESNSSHSYIYFAWAENPFKYANAN